MLQVPPQLLCRVEQAAHHFNMCHPLSRSVQELGAAALSKRPTSCMLVLPKPPKGGADDDEAKEFAEAYGEAEKKVRAAMPVL